MLKSLNIPAINELLWNLDTNDVADKLVGEINKALDLTAPIKKIQLHNNYAPHLSETTKLKMKQRDQLKQKSLKTEDQDDHKVYKIFIKYL